MQALRSALLVSGQGVFSKVNTVGFFVSCPGKELLFLESVFGLLLDKNG